MMSVLFRHIFNVCEFLILSFFSFVFFFNDTATTEIYTLSLHDALPISAAPYVPGSRCWSPARSRPRRSEEHTSELQSPVHLVCRLLLEKKKKKPTLSHAKTTTKKPNIPPLAI